MEISHHGKMRDVAGVIFRMIWSIWAGTALLACTDVTGGAVEVSWSLQVPEGAGVSCASARIARMRLYWEADGEASFASWPCTDAHGVTKFEVPVGSAILRMTPECQNGQEATYGTYVAPAPIVRDIAQGDVVRLDAIVVHLITPTAGSPSNFCTENACVCR